MTAYVGRGPAISKLGWILHLRHHLRHDLVKGRLGNDLLLHQAPLTEMVSGPQRVVPFATRCLISIIYPNCSSKLSD